MFYVKDVFGLKVEAANKIRQIRERVARAVDAGKAREKTKPRPKPKTRRPVKRKAAAEAAE